MSTHEDRPNPLDHAIDRLIDGELFEPERRALLLQLDNEPDGWRRCALAFLEDQAWRGALAGVAPPVPKSIELRPEPIPTGKSWLRRVSIAASLIGLTFAAGFAAGGRSTPSPRPEIAQHPAPGSSEKRPAPPTSTVSDQIREVGKIDLVDGSSGEVPLQSLPIYSGPGLDDRWLRNQPSTIPDYVRARWEREGYQLEERRSLVSVTLEDGREVSIPVDEVALNYVGRNPL